VGNQCTGRNCMEHTMKVPWSAELCKGARRSSLVFTCILNEVTRDGFCSCERELVDLN
jgi:hypothetical protein